MERLYIARIKDALGEWLDMATVAEDEETVTAHVAELYGPIGGMPSYEVVAFLESRTASVIDAARSVDDLLWSHGTGSVEFHVAMSRLHDALSEKNNVG